MEEKTLNSHEQQTILNNMATGDLKGKGTLLYYFGLR